MSLATYSPIQGIPVQALVEEALQEDGGGVTPASVVAAVQAMTQEQLAAIQSPVSGGLWEPHSAHPPEPVKDTYLTFIDDDTRIETYQYWKQLAAEFGIKITLATVPNWVMQNGPVAKPAMNITQLREMYDAGHDLVSHGFNTTTIQDGIDDAAYLDTELRLSRKWLIDNGFTRNDGYNYFVWPQGLSGTALLQKRTKAALRTHGYVAAVNAFTAPVFTPASVFDNYNIPRVTGDGATGAALIAKLDQTIAANGWMCVLSHAYHATDQDGGSYATWSQRYRELITYALAQGVKIRTLPEVYKLRGNVIAAGDWLDYPGCFYVGANGSVYGGTAGIPSSNVPSGSLGMGANQALAAATPTKLMFTANPEFDDLAAWDKTNGRFVCPTTGRYEFWVKISTLAAPTASIHMSLNVYKNGVLTINLDQGTDGTQGPISRRGSFIFTLVPGDVIEIYANPTLAITVSAAGLVTRWQYKKLS